MEQRLKTRIDCWVNRLRREDVNLHGFILSVHGQEKVTAYYEPFRAGQPHRLYSVSKTMTALALGILMEEGRVSPDSRIAEFFSDLLPEEPDPWLMELKIRDMLRMATCFRRTVYREYSDPDWTRPFCTTPAHHAPGTVFNYDTSCAQVLASLVRRLSGKEVIDFLEKRLFAPLGCEDPRSWLRDPSGQCTGGTGLCMSLRDLNRVALCLARGGDGLVPGWFVAEMQKKQIDTLQQPNEEERWGYGWQCWRNRAGWMLYGMGGQLAVLLPDMDAVLCTIGDVRLDPCGMQRIYDSFFDEVYPYLDTEDMEPLTLSLPAPVLQDNQSFAHSGDADYTFTENMLGLDRLCFRKNELILIKKGETRRLPFSPGETIFSSFPGWPEEPASVSSGWFAPDSLRIRCHNIGLSPCGFDLVLVFRKDSVTLSARRSSDIRTEGFEGTATGKLIQTGADPAAPA